MLLQEIAKGATVFVISGQTWYNMMKVTLKKYSFSAQLTKGHQEK